MFRKTITSALILLYALTIPTLLAFHIHALGIGTGNVGHTACQGATTPTGSSSTQSASCQICSRLASLNLFQVDSERSAIEPYGQRFEPLEVATYSHRFLHTCQLRAPPFGFVS